MINRLALRNVKGQWGSYLLYFFTVTFTVSMLFAVENLLYSAELEKISASLSDISTMINFSVALVSVVSAVVLGYTSAFMVRLRSREFGLYLTVGMRRRDIMTLFATETAIISAVALATGFVFGFLVYEALMSLLTRIMDISFSFSLFSLKGTVSSISTALCIFLFSSLFSLAYLRKATISSLLSPPKSEKNTRHTTLWLLALILLFGAMTSSFFTVFTEMEKSLSGKSEGGGVMMMLFLCILFCFLFHFVLSKVLFSLLSGNRRIMGKGKSSIIVRSLQGKATTNALLMGTISVLFLIAIGASCISVTEKAINDMDIDKSVPYSVMAFSDGDEGFFSRIEEVTEEYTGIKSSYSYALYSQGQCQISRNIKGAVEMGWIDYFMALSDFNALMVGFGREKVTLEEGEYVVASRYREVISDVDFPIVELEGKEYRPFQVSFSYPDFFDRSVVYVVPDSAVSSMERVRECRVYSIDVPPQDPLDFQERLNQVKGPGDRVWSRDRAKFESSSTAGVLIIAMLFVSTVSVALSLAILSVKTLSSVNEDRRTMGILRALGIDESGRQKIVASETLVFFLLPMVIPLVLSLPISEVCAMVYRSWGMDESVWAAYVTAFSVDLFIVVVSALYFFVTLRIKLTAIAHRERKE